MRGIYEDDLCRHPSGAVSGGSSGSWEPIDFSSLVITRPNLPVILAKFSLGTTGFELLSAPLLV